MKRLTVLGNYGKSNLGDEAIGAAITLAAGVAFGDAVVTLATPGRFAPVATSRVRVNVAQNAERLALTASERSWSATLRQTDLLLVGGGGLLMDLHRWAVPKYALAALSARMLGIPVGLVGVSAGPLTSRVGRTATNVLLSCSSSMFFRDRQSLEIIGQRWSGKARTMLDPVFALPPVTPVRSPTRTIGISVIPWGSREGLYPSVEGRYEDYVEQTAALVCEILNRGCASAVTLLCFDWKKDVGPARDIERLVRAQCSRAEVSVFCVERWELLWSRVAALDAVVAVRLHSLIFARALAVPVVPVVYQDKVRGVLRELDMEDEGIELKPGWSAKVLARLENMVLASQDDGREAQAIRVRTLELTAEAVSSALR